MTSRGPLRVIMPNFVKIGQTVTDISRFIDFSKMALSAILDLLDASSDEARTVLVSLNRYTKFGCNWCSSFDNMAILILHPFGLKTPIHAPKKGLWGLLTP